MWLDPVLYSKLVDAVTAELVKVDPKCRDTFERNAVDLQDGDRRGGTRRTQRVCATASGARSSPRTRRSAISRSSTAFAQEGIAGIAPDEEPNAQRLAELADLVRKNKITTIFTEELVSPKVADALAREAGGVKTETLNPLESLSDRESAQGDDWASVMRANLAKIRVALGCTST